MKRKSIRLEKVGERYLRKACAKAKTAMVVGVAKTALSADQKVQPVKRWGAPDEEYALGR